MRYLFGRRSLPPLSPRLPSRRFQSRSTASGSKPLRVTTASTLPARTPAASFTEPALGFDFSAGGAVLGLEAEYTDSAAKECFDDFGAQEQGCAPRSAVTSTSVPEPAHEWPPTAALRKGGLYNARLETPFRAAPSGRASTGASSWTGYRLGAGAEFALSPSSFVNAEHRFSHYARTRTISWAALPSILSTCPERTTTSIRRSPTSACASDGSERSASLRRREEGPGASPPALFYGGLEGL
jgi:hypothetical protein